MKKFLQGVIEWKAHACFLYTAAMCWYLIFTTAFGGEEVSVRKLWALFLLCAAASLIQGFCFSSWIIKKMRYTLRSLLFVLLFLPALSLAAWKMEWFPTERAGSWILFVVIFFAIFAVMTLGFDIYFQITGRKYDGLLGQYRKHKEQEERED